MALSLKELQAKLIEQQAKKDRARSGSGGYGGDNAVYPFWNNPEGSTATLRFLPDGDDSNGFFWLERLIIKLPFPGVKGSTDSRPVTIQVPCTDMWKNKTCPITAEISPWWKDADMENMARKYYRKKSFLFQGFVNDNPNKEDNTPENPIRRFIINPSVFDVVKSVLLDKDLENSPTDYTNGIDFYLTKTTKGQYANYTSSKWSRKERALSDAELAAIATYGLWNLSTFLPKKPDDEHLAAMMEMFEASVQEELYDPERWGKFYRPSGMKYESETATDTGTTVPQVQPAITKPVVTAEDILSKVEKSVTETVTDTVTVAPATTKKAQTPDEIIAAIRARQASK